jgi:lipopolysaccharide cholinephosphotransferase
MEGILVANFWKRLAGKIQYGEYYKLIKPEIGKLFKKYKSKGKRVVIWGAGLKGNAFLSVTDPEARYVEAVIDRNESLYGTRLVSGHLVVDVSYVIENPVDIVFIMSGVQYVDNYFLLSKSGFKGQVFDMDYLVKKHISWEQVYYNNFEKVDFNDNKLFGYTMSEIQQKLLEILKEVDRICRKHKITYFLEAGSALGAYRYQDFLQSDYDIDIAMLRDEYERFTRIAPGELNSKFLLQQRAKGSQYFYPYAQVVMDHTCFVPEGFQDFKMHLGLHIDVAPLDNVVADKKLQKEHFQRMQKITKTIWDKLHPEEFDSRNIFKKLVVNSRYYLLKFIPMALLTWMQEREFARYSSTDTGWVGDLCTHYKKVIAFEKKHLLPVNMMKFSDGEYPVPKDIEYYLGIMYDDYKKLSPRENGSVKYDMAAVSLEKNYGE